MTIAEKLTKIAENEPKIYDAGRKSLYDKLARCKEVGETVLIAKALGMEQPAEVSVSSKNLIPYPYADTTKTVNGVTFTDNGDGSITVNGTATELAYFILQKGKWLLPGKYFLSGCPASGSSDTYYITTNGYNGESDIGTGRILDITSDLTQTNIAIIIKPGTTVSNLVFKPQLEPGMTAAAYTPYVAGLSAVSVKKHGKNLIPYPYTDTTKTVNGITFTDNGDGTITVNGTASDTANFMCLSLSSLGFKKGIYTLTSGIGNDNSGLSYGAVLGYLYSGNTRQTAGTKNGNCTVSLSQDAMCDVVFTVRSGVTCNNLVFKPQLEPGDAATEYEPYKAPAIYTPDASGKVTGVTLDDSTSFFTTDTAGVLLTVEYSSDYNAGQKNAYDAFWDAYQQNGNRTDYEYAFAGLGWTSESFKPKYPIAPTAMNQMFNSFKAVTDLTNPAGVSFDFTKITGGANYAFTSSAITKLPKISCKKNSLGAGYLFYIARSLTTVTELELPDTAMTSSQATTQTFAFCTALKNIKITGVIANTGFDLHWSTRLTIESLISILSALSKDSGIAAGKSITLPTAAQAKINADTTAKAQYDSAIAAGWTIAFA